MSKDHFTARVTIKEVNFIDITPQVRGLGSTTVSERKVSDVLDVTVRADSLELLQTKIATVMSAA